jgi:hypothetical protein
MLVYQRVGCRSSGSWPEKPDVMRGDSPITAEEQFTLDLEMKKLLKK